MAEVIPPSALEERLVSTLLESDEVRLVRLVICEVIPCVSEVSCCPTCATLPIALAIFVLIAPVIAEIAPLPVIEVICPAIRFWMLPDVRLLSEPS